MRLRFLLLIAFFLGVRLFVPRAARAQALPDSVHSEGVPTVPGDLDWTIDHDRFSDRASFQGWWAGTRRVLYLSESGVSNKPSSATGPVNRRGN